MYPTTIDNITTIIKNSQLTTGGDAIKISVDIAKLVTDVIKRGGRVILEEKDNSQSVLNVDYFKKVI